MPSLCVTFLDRASTMFEKKAAGVSASRWLDSRTVSFCQLPDTGADTGILLLRLWLPQKRWLVSHPIIIWECVNKRWTCALNPDICTILRLACGYGRRKSQQGSPPVPTRSRTHENAATNSKRSDGSTLSPPNPSLQSINQSAQTRRKQQQRQKNHTQDLPDMHFLHAVHKPKDLRSVVIACDLFWVPFLRYTCFFEDGRFLLRYCAIVRDKQTATVLRSRCRGERSLYCKGKGNQQTKHEMTQLVCLFRWAR